MKAFPVPNRARKSNQCKEFLTLAAGVSGQYRMSSAKAEGRDQKCMPTVSATVWLRKS